MKPGQRLILGLKQTHLTNSFKRLLRDKQIGGVVLFDRNAEDLGQLRNLVCEIKEPCSITPFIATDFEGGRVRHFADFFRPLANPTEYAGEFAKLKSVCQEIGGAFNEIGMNINFAPVVDLSYSPVNPALSDRTFSYDPSQVSDYCLNFYEGFSSKNVICCFKHFPGLGSAVNDPHYETAISCVSRERILTNDIIPFKAGIAKGVKMIMTTHLLITAIDDKIATFSKSVIGMARELGFEGLMITDDMSMGAVKRSLPLPRAVLEALCAGHDMALICHDHDEYPDIINHLEKNLKLLQWHGHEKALQRISDVKKSLP
jgi:beta-N-acetylhexosaminidase